MKKIILILCSAVLVSNNLAQEKQQTEHTVKKTEVVLETIWEKQFDEPVVDVIYDETEMAVSEAKKLGIKGLEKRKDEEKIKVKYPKVVVAGEKVKYSEKYEQLEPTSLKFYDEKGKIKKEIFLRGITPKGWKTKAGFPKNKKYIGILSNIHRYKEENPSEAKFTMIDDAGETLWEVNISKVGYGFPYISPNGEYIVCIGDITGDYFSYMPSIWNSKGLVKKLFEDYQEISYLDFSKDGSWFVVTTRGLGTKNIAHLIVFDEKGNELWTKENIASGWAYVTGLSVSDNDVINITTFEPIRFGFDPSTKEYKFKYYYRTTKKGGKIRCYIGDETKYYFNKNGNLIHKEIKRKDSE